MQGLGWLGFLTEYHSCCHCVDRASPIVRTNCLDLHKYHHGPPHVSFERKLTVLDCDSNLYLSIICKAVAQHILNAPYAYTPELSVIRQMYLQENSSGPDSHNEELCYTLSWVTKRPEFSSTRG